ncbi:MAG: DUF4349 domain-containing protein [Turneriella sp.]
MNKLVQWLGVAVLAVFTSHCSSGKAAYRETMPAPAMRQSASESTSGGLSSPASVSAGEVEDSRPQAPQSPLLIYTSQLSLEVKEADIKQVSGQIVDKAKGFGGYLSQRASNSLIVRVPAKEFNTLNDYIKTLAKVKYENVTAQDVTMHYTDLKIRLDVQLKMLARYQDLLKRAANVKEAVEVERELSRITERVEQLKGQIRYYDSQISFSTINVSFQEPYSAFTKETKPGPLGWVFYGLYVGVKWLFVWD